VRGHALSRVFYFENKYDFYYSILYWNCILSNVKFLP
jgi:hypothetical protein